MLFSDPAYQPFPELLQLGKRITAEPEGRGAYSYFKAGTRDPISKDAWWVNVTVHGRAWRLVSIHPSEKTGMGPPAGAVNRFGYPPENSLFDVDLRKQTDAASRVIVPAIENRKQLVYSGPLVEGGQARYSLMPVMNGRTYLGSLLWIQKE